jgi:hypothetical protein
LRQVADQMLSGDAGHGAVSVMNAPIAVIPEGVGESIGDFGRVGRTERRCVCHAGTVAGGVGMEQELEKRPLCCQRRLGPRDTKLRPFDVIS